MLAAERDGALHGGQRIQIAGAFVPVPALKRAQPRRGRGLARGIDAAVANGFHKARKAVDAVRIDAVARGFGKEAGAALGALGREAELAQNSGEGLLHFGEGDAVHGLSETAAVSGVSGVRTDR